MKSIFEFRVLLTAVILICSSLNSQYANSSSWNSDQEARLALNWKILAQIEAEELQGLLVNFQPSFSGSEELFQSYAELAYRANHVGDPAAVDLLKRVDANLAKEVSRLHLKFRLVNIPDEGIGLYIFYRRFLHQSFDLSHLPEKEVGRNKISSLFSRTFNYLANDLQRYRFKKPHQGERPLRDPEVDREVLRRLLSEKGLPVTWDSSDLSRYYEQEYAKRLDQKNQKINELRAKIQTPGLSKKRLAALREELEAAKDQSVVGEQVDDINRRRLIRKKVLSQTINDLNQVSELDRWFEFWKSRIQLARERNLSSLSQILDFKKQDIPSSLFSDSKGLIGKGLRSIVNLKVFKPFFTTSSKKLTGLSKFKSITFWVDGKKVKLTRKDLIGASWEIVPLREEFGERATLDPPWKKNKTTKKQRGIRSRIPAPSLSDVEKAEAVILRVPGAKKVLYLGTVNDALEIHSRVGLRNKKKAALDALMKYRADYRPALRMFLTEAKNRDRLLVELLAKLRVLQASKLDQVKVISQLRSLDRQMSVLGLDPFSNLTDTIQRRGGIDNLDKKSELMPLEFDRYRTDPYYWQIRELRANERNLPSIQSLYENTTKKRRKGVLRVLNTLVRRVPNGLRARLTGLKRFPKTLILSSIGLSLIFDVGQAVGRTVTIDNLSYYSAKWEKEALEQEIAKSKTYSSEKFKRTNELQDTMNRTSRGFGPRFLERSFIFQHSLDIAEDVVKSETMKNTIKYLGENFDDFFHYFKSLDQLAELLSQVEGLDLRNLELPENMEFDQDIMQKILKEIEQKDLETPQSFEQRLAKAIEKANIDWSKVKKGPFHHSMYFEGLPLSNLKDIRGTAKDEVVFSIYPDKIDHKKLPKYFDFPDANDFVNLSTENPRYFGYKIPNKKGLFSTGMTISRDDLLVAAQTGIIKIFPIPTPPAYEPSRVTIQFRDKKIQIDDILHDSSKQLFAIDLRKLSEKPIFDELLSNSRFHLGVEFLPDQKPSKPKSSWLRVDTNRLKEVINELEKYGMTELSKNLEKLLRRSKRISMSQVVSVIRESGRYSFDSEKINVARQQLAKVRDWSNYDLSSLKLFTPFLAEDGCLHYQSICSASLTRFILGKLAPNDSYQVKAVGSYYRKGGEMHSDVSDFRLRTALSYSGIRETNYLALDSTPRVLKDGSLLGATDWTSFHQAKSSWMKEVTLLTQKAKELQLRHGRKVQSLEAAEMVLDEGRYLKQRISNLDSQIRNIDDQHNELMKESVGIYRKMLDREEIDPKIDTEALKNRRFVLRQRIEKLKIHRERLLRASKRLSNSPSDDMKILEEEVNDIQRRFYKLQNELLEKFPNEYKGFGNGKKNGADLRMLPTIDQAPPRDPKPSRDFWTDRKFFTLLRQNQIPREPIPLDPPNPSIRGSILANRRKKQLKTKAVEIKPKSVHQKRADEVSRIRTGILENDELQSFAKKMKRDFSGALRGTSIRRTLEVLSIFKEEFEKGRLPREIASEILGARAISQKGEKILKKKGPLVALGYELEAAIESEISGISGYYIERGEQIASAKKLASEGNSKQVKHARSRFEVLDQLYVDIQSGNPSSLIRKMIDSTKALSELEKTVAPTCKRSLIRRLAGLK